MTGDRNAPARERPQRARVDASDRRRRANDPVERRLALGDTHRQARRHLHAQAIRVGERPNATIEPVEQAAAVGPRRAELEPARPGRSGGAAPAGGEAKRSAWNLRRWRPRPLEGELEPDEQVGERRPNAPTAVAQFDQHGRRLPEARQARQRLEQPNRVLARTAAVAVRLLPRPAKHSLARVVATGDTRKSRPERKQAHVTVAREASLRGPDGASRSARHAPLAPTPISRRNGPPAAARGAAAPARTIANTASSPAVGSRRGFDPTGTVRARAEAPAAAHGHARRPPAKAKHTRLTTFLRSNPRARSADPRHARRCHATSAPWVAGLRPVPSPYYRLVRPFAVALVVLALLPTGVGADGANKRSGQARCLSSLFEPRSILL